MLAFLSEDTPPLRPYFISDFKLLPQYYQNLMAGVNFCNTGYIKKVSLREGVVPNLSTLSKQNVQI